MCLYWTVTVKRKQGWEKGVRHATKVDIWNQTGNSCDHVDMRLPRRSKHYIFDCSHHKHTNCPCTRIVNLTLVLCDVCKYCVPHIFSPYILLKRLYTLCFFTFHVIQPHTTDKSVRGHICCPLVSSHLSWSMIKVLFICGCSSQAC